jgi:hypothetical protein
LAIDIVAELLLLPQGCSDKLGQLYCCFRRWEPNAAAARNYLRFSVELTPGC